MCSSTAVERLEKQIEFIVEIDKVKQVLRRTYLVDQSRRENDAEHSWHLAVMALLLCEYAKTPVDAARVVKMVLVHDLVEIDVGDMLVYDACEEGESERTEKERAAAERVFGLLPADQEADLRAMWEEFEGGETPEARFARALDRFQPLLHNYHTRGRAWREHGVTPERVLALNQPILAEGAPALEAYAAEMVADAVAEGYLESET